MRLSSLLAIAVVLAAPTLTYADTVLVGSNLSTISGGSSLCPSDADCEEIAQQVTFLTPVVIDQIKVAISGPALMGSTAGDFNVELGDMLGTGTEIGSGELAFDPNGDPVTGVFGFSGLNISLGAGTYYLQLSGGNVDWDFAEPLITAAGTLGPIWVCDPTISCASDRWQSVEGTHAFEIDGTATTPEPSTFALLGTGMLGIVGVARRKLSRHD
jgi:PEP-CTERM motif